MNVLQGAFTTLDVGKPSARYFFKRGEYIKVDEAVYFRNSPHAPMRLTVVGD